MEILVSREWLRKKISEDPDWDNDVGPPLDLLENLGMFLPSDLLDVDREDEQSVELKLAFGVLIRQLRLSKNMAIMELAKHARIAEDDLRAIEHDPHHKPRPRAVHQLSLFFDLPEREMMKLSGATITHDKEFKEAAYRFAANSDDLSELTEAERQELNQFVSYLIDKHNR